MVFRGGDPEMEGETGKRVVVADASVIVKWFVEEEYSDNARALKRAYSEGLVDIAVPSLMKYEVLNALKYSGAFGEDDLKTAATILDAFQFTTYDLEEDYAAKTVEAAIRKGITIYDAAYVALAQLLGTALYTADEKLMRKVGDQRLVRHVRDLVI